MIHGPVSVPLLGLFQLGPGFSQVNLEKDFVLPADIFGAD
jgi:hypothetical protein